jgi:TfoX/Sxy family transcriptional regulator of competence genes
VRAALQHVPEVEEKAMFGGLTFMVHGKMCICVGKDRLMCRIDPAIHDSVLTRKWCRTMVMNGRSYRGYVHVDEEAVRVQKEFDYWIRLALDYNPKAKPAARR